MRHAHVKQLFRAISASEHPGRGSFQRAERTARFTIGACSVGEVTGRIAENWLIAFTLKKACKYPNSSPTTYTSSGAISYDSSLFGSETFPDTFGQAAVLFYESSTTDSSIVATTTGTTLSIECNSIVWNSGPFAGQLGSTSIGTGTFSEAGASPQGVEQTLNGTCTVTLQ